MYRGEKKIRKNFNTKIINSPEDCLCFQIVDKESQLEKSERTLVASRSTEEGIEDVNYYTRYSAQSLILLSCGNFTSFIE